MRYFVFDTETSGFGFDDYTPAEVIQFAGFLLDDKFNIIKCYNFYCNIASIIPQDAIRVHGINNKKLDILANGKFIEDYLDKDPVFREDTDIVFVGYNASFDIGMTNKSLRKHGYREIDFGRTVKCLPTEDGFGRVNFCLMKYVASNFNGANRNKFMKLNQARQMFLPELSDDNAIGVLLGDVLTEFDCFNDSLGGLHNASFDAFLTMFLLERIHNISMGV